jgi:hypothetical protein
MFGFSLYFTLRFNLFTKERAMKTSLTVVTLTIAAAWLAAPAAAQEHPMQPSKGFEQLKPLIGEWDGQAPGGKALHASYQLVSGGTGLLERLAMGGEPEMVTVYTPDGDRLAVTHFCSAGNQPQMRTEPVTGPTTEFSFSFVRATNLASPTVGHMHHLTVALQDHDRFSEAWTWSENGKDHTEVFHFTRKS